MLVKQCPHCDSRFRRDLSFCPIDGAALTTLQDPFLGLTVAGRYYVEERLGSGAMGTVYRARHRVIGRDVALKFLEPQLCKDERQRRRFLGEARAANQVDHEHIIDISDYGETDDGLVYMVMEYLQGHTLADEIDHGPLSVHRSLEIARQVAQALARAHELGVVHRDVKPANIYLLSRDGKDFVKLLDFGVARIQADLRITAQDTIVGTPEYIAPEQIRSATATPATDMYALGCVLFEMLTGQLPFEGNTTILLVKHLNDPPPTPSGVSPQVPPEVDALVMRTMAKAAELRHRDAYHLAEELLRLLEKLPDYVSEPPPLVLAAPTRSQAPPEIPEEANWARVLQSYRIACTEAYKGRDEPKWLTDAIETIAQGLDEVRRTRADLERAAQRATNLVEDARGPRVQIGYALDELAHDGSRVGRRIQDLDAKIAQANGRIVEYTDILCAEAKQVGEPLEAGTALEPDQASHIRRILEAIEGIERTNGELAIARQQRQLQQNVQSDLKFQIAQLKDQLLSLNRNTTLDQEASHASLRAMDARIQERLATLEPVATRIADHFKAFPELRDHLAGLAEHAVKHTG